VGWKLEAVPVLPYYLSSVEREPMWDGNPSSSNNAGNHRVEREPMWDGNMRILFITDSTFPC